MTRRPALLTGIALFVALLAGQVVAGWSRPVPIPAAQSAEAVALPAARGSAAAPGKAGKPPAKAPADAPARNDRKATPAPPRAGASATAPPPRGTPGGRGGIGRAGRDGREESGTPRPDTSEGLAALGVRRTTGGSSVALTFDDGPHPEWTPKVLAILREQRVRATFCVVGVEVRRHPQLVAQIAREGHTLCNHSWQHQFTLGAQQPPVIRADLQRTNDEIRRAVPGARIAYFRHPGGNWTPAATQVSRELGMTPLGWVVDPKDWDKATAKEIEERVLARTRPGAVVLLHDGGGDRSATVAATEALVPALKRRHRLAALR